MPTYIASQLAQLKPAEHHYSLQIRSDAGGHTNHLNVTPQQLERIAQVLEGAVIAAPQLEIQRTLVISTSHLPKHELFYLIDQVLHRTNQGERADNVCQLIVDAIGRDYGYRICLDKEATEDYLTDHPTNADPLARLLRFAIEQGCDWLALDRDGNTVEGLPTYEDED